jgi:hypothetical protein
MNRTVVTADMVKNNPALLAKSINDAVEGALQGTESARSNPFTAVTIIKQQKLTHGVPVNLKHNLGSNWSYAYVVHAYPGSSIAPVTLIESTTAAPVGITKSNSCTVIPAILNTTLSATVTTTSTVTPGSGVYDIMIAAS